MKFIFKSIQFIILFYLLILLFIKAFIVTQVHIYNNDYPNIKGYAILFINESDTNVDIKKRDYLIFKKDNEYKNNDIVYTNKKKYCKVIQVKNENIDGNENKNVLELNCKGEIQDINKKDIYGKLIYKNKYVSIIINIFTHPITILILLLLIIKLSSKSYKRY